MHKIEIRVKGRLDENWSAWLGDFTFEYMGSDVTVLTGTIEDQTAMYGLIAKLRDLGLDLISVNMDTAENESTGTP